MPWHARLALDYSAPNPSRTIARFRHDGPLRILQSLYPEGDAVCHNVLVHPPGGLVGGDVLDIRIRAAAGAHGLVTTPGATRFYRSEGETAVQRTAIALDPGARLEWLPLEAICFDGCLAENRLRLDPVPLDQGSRDPAELDAALAECLAHEGPFFLDVQVAAQENCFPMMPSGHGHHRVMLAKDRWYDDDEAGGLAAEAGDDAAR